MATTSTMFMYSLTIQSPTAITQAILGQFMGTREQQIVTASGSKLTVHRPDPTQGKITPLFSQDVFGIIRSLAAFRLAGSSKGMFHIPYWIFKINLVILQASRAARSPSAEPTPLAGSFPVGDVDAGYEFGS